MSLSMAFVCALSIVLQLDDSPVTPIPTVVEAAPNDDQYIEITRIGEAVVPAVYHAPVDPPSGEYPVALTTVVHAQRPTSPPGAISSRPATPADVPPSLVGPITAAEASLPAGPRVANPGVSTRQSLFTNGYGGTRAYAVALPPMAPPSLPPGMIGRGSVAQPRPSVPYQPVRNFFRRLSP